MLATFAFDVCHDVYRAAREVIDTKIPTMSLESSGKYLWHPDRMPRLAEYVADFARAGERALGDGGRDGMFLDWRSGGRQVCDLRRTENPQTEACATKTCVAGACASKACACKTCVGKRELCRAGRTVLPGAARGAWSRGSRDVGRASRMALFRVYYLGGAEYQPARRHLGISELTWADWVEEIRARVGKELAGAGVFPPSKYFREMTKAS